MSSKVIRVLFCGREQMVSLFRSKLSKKLYYGGKSELARYLRYTCVTDDLDLGRNRFYKYVLIDSEWLDSAVKYRRVVLRSMDFLNDSNLENPEIGQGSIFLVGSPECQGFQEAVDRGLADPKPELPFVFLDSIINQIYAEARRLANPNH